MFDKDTLIITYDAGRGEPRGARSKKADPKAAGPRRLRRLRHLRAGLPDRHRHPQGPAVRVHRLRRVHRRLRPGDGQDGLPARASSATRRENALAQGPTTARRCGGACSAPRTLRLHRGAARDHRRRGRRFARARAIRSRSTSMRDRGALAREAAPGVDRERLPAADHEHRRDAAPVHGSRRRACPGLKVVGVDAADRGSAPQSRSWCRCACRRRRTPRTPGSAQGRAAIDDGKDDAHKVELVARRSTIQSCREHELPVSALDSALATDDRPCHVRSATARARPGTASAGRGC